MKQLNKFKVGDVVLTKFPVTFEVTEDKAVIAVTKEKKTACNELTPCGCHDYGFFDAGYIVRKNLADLKMVPRIVGDKVEMFIETTVISEVSLKKEKNIQLVTVDAFGDVLINHATFIKKGR